MVKDALRGYLALASGVTEVTAARARAAARILVEQGESTAGQISTLAEDLMETSRRNREGLVLIVRHEVEATLRRLGLGAAGDLDALSQRVRRLEQAVREAARDGAGAQAPRADVPRPAATKTSGKRTTRKKSAAKSSAKSAAKKTTAKRASAQKSSTKRTAAKRPAAKKNAAKKTTERTPVKKTTKRSAAKKSTSKRATATRQSSRTGRRRSS